VGSATENVCLIGPAGTGKSHMLVALGIAAVEHGHRVRYVTAADLVETLLPRTGRQLRRPVRVIDTCSATTWSSSTSSGSRPWTTLAPNLTLERAVGRRTWEDFLTERLRSDTGPVRSAATRPSQSAAKG
jgi:KaiC/GvpD/RAD55 family RecA-like ATPase